MFDLRELSWLSKVFPTVEVEKTYGTLCRHLGHSCISHIIRVFAFLHLNQLIYFSITPSNNALMAPILLNADNIGLIKLHVP